MFKLIAASVVFTLLSMSTVFAQAPNPPAVTLVKEKTPDGMEARLLRSEFAPNTSSPWHTHPTPVMIYVLEGTGVWELDGLPSKTLTAGQATLEPANTRTRVANNDATQTLKLVLVQMSDPAKPFSAPVK